MKINVRRLMVVLLLLAIPASLLAQRSPAEVLKRIEKGFKKEKLKLNVELEGATAILVIGNSREKRNANFLLRLLLLLLR